MANKHKHILKLCSDQHSPVISGFAGNNIVRTPNLDRLAKNGVVFENHYANNPVCTPGRYSMLTGLLPREIGTCRFTDILPLDTHTYMRHFSQHGYMTMCVGKMHFHGPEQMYGWMARPYGDMEVSCHSEIQGYSEELDVVGGIAAANARKKIKYGEYGGYNAYMLKTAGPGTDQFMVFDESVTREAVINLKNYFEGIIDQRYQGSRPLLYEVSWKTPHCPFVGLPDLYEYYRERVSMPEKRLTDEPYAKLPPFLKRRYKTDQTEDITDDMILNSIAAYYALVEFTDRQIGIVLDALEELVIMDEFNIMYTSDHGEMLGKHGVWQKSCYYEESVRVPMILYGADIPKGVKVKHNTSHVDVFPTLCEMAGLPLPESIRGRSVLPLINEKEEQDNIIFSEIYTAECLEKPLFMAKWRNIKFIEYNDGYTQLFDLEKDPKELDNKTDDNAYSHVKSMLKNALDELQ